ncbi:hypothetical protein ACHAWF_017923 [Thalassiosira exigua]
MTAATLLLLSSLAAVAAALASSSPPRRSYLVTGANKGQGYALCRRILAEHEDSHVFLCSRDVRRGDDAKKSLVEECGDESRVDVVQLDVTDDASVAAASEAVKRKLGDLAEGQTGGKLSGVVSNAGILWGHPLPDLMDVCATGVRRVLDAFVPLVEDDGRVVVVTSGLGPLMHSYAGERRRAALKDAESTWDESLAGPIEECLAAYAASDSVEERIAAFEAIEFPGGPFAESAPDFHMYGLAKMFGDAHMLRVARKHPNLRVTSVDPGLVYTDLILNMPKYAGKERGDTGAQSPEEGVEGGMRLLFEDVGRGEGSGKLYALTKERELVFSDIDKMPQKQYDS